MLILMTLDLVISDDDEVLILTGFPEGRMQKNIITTVSWPTMQLSQTSPTLPQTSTAINI